MPAGETEMEYFVGASIALGVCVFATLAGLDRDRAFYPVVLIVIASYYDLFAVMGGGDALGIETAAFAAFVCIATIGFKTNLWIVAAALLAHGLFDFVHADLVANAGVPVWWPMFCLSFDAAAAGYIAWLLLSGRLQAHSARSNDKQRQRSGSSSGAKPIARGAVSLALLGGVLVSAASCAAAPADVRFASIDGRQVAYRVLGTGQPVVVMISGLGDGMATFRHVAPELAETATVILYDRAGYGGSDATSETRDAEAIERELSALLEQSGIAGPYVLAGHSIGGSFAEYYAAKHPDQISGLILEESRPADFTRRCEAAGVSMCAPTVSMARAMPAGAQAEVAALAMTMAEVESAGAISETPMLVLSRPERANQNAFDALWSAAQRDLAARYPGSLHLVANSGGHYVHRDQRDWYVASVRAFLSGEGARNLN